MSDGVAQNGETQAVSAGGAAVAANGATVVATAAAASGAAAPAPASVPGAAAVTAPSAPVAPVHAGHAAAAAPAAVEAAPAPAKNEADCKPKKVAAKNKDEKRASDDEDQNLSQPADGCVLPVDGQVAAPATPAAEPAPVVDGGEGGGGIPSGLLIGAGVLAAIGVGVLALAKDDEDKNAPPVANADTAAATEGGASVTGSVATNDTDPNNDTLTFTLTGTAPAGLTFNNNGSFTFDPSNAAYNALAAGATQTITVPYSVSDGKGGTATSNLTITVTGTNDNPTAVADTATATEGATAAITGDLRANDTDPDTGQAATLTYTLNAPVAGLTVNTNGTFSFNAADPAYNSLAAGQTQQVVANVTARDASGGTSTSTLTITVTGTNDVPTAVADTAVATEGGAVVTGNVATNDTDPDQGQTATLTFSLAAPVAGLTLNTDGTFSFDPTNAAYNSLAAGQTQQVVANVNVRDASGGTSTSTLTITVTGTNDAPVAVARTASGNEDTQITGNLNATDPDTGAVLTYSVVGTAPAGFTLNSATGAFTLDTTNAAYQGLTQGQVQNVVVNYQVSDGTLTSTSTLTIAVTGQAEAANLDVDTDADLGTRAAFDAGTTDFAFTDARNVANTVVINNFGADDFITFDAPFSGAGAASFEAVDFDNDGAADDLRIRTTNTDGLVSDVVLIGVVDTNVAVFGEATAEAAVAGTDNFRTTAATAVPTGVSLDVDNDSNINSRFTIATVANTGTFNFTDDAAFANSVLVRDFGADDTLTFNTAQENVTFVSGDFDSDGAADDVQVTVTNGTTVSSTVLTNSIAANTAVTSLATAEAAIGSGVANFVFNGTVIAPPAPPPAGTTTANLDTDDDNNPNTVRVFDAGTDAFRFTDDADVANSVRIVNIGANDRIVLDGTLAAGNVYAFSNRDLDDDTEADDLEISVNINGTVSNIIILNSVNSSAVVFDEATAEAAVNARFGTTGIDYFSFA